MECTETLFSSLGLHGLQFKVKLGCGEEERRIPQEVRFYIRVRFPSPPSACQSDQLEETVCYAELSEKIEAISREEYRLIEKLGWDTFSCLKKILPEGAQLWVKIHKVNPPISNLLEGSSFCIGDWEEG
jgi:7,8-dihydroneopterin aldolase/epimerase/oxygenase